MQIGFVGLGRMGMNMVTRLVQGGHQVVAWNRTQEKVKEVVKIGATGAATVEELVREKTRIFDEVAAEGAVIIDGVLSFVDMLRQNGIPIAVCSGATRNDIDLILEGTSLASRFDPVVTADDVKEGKPNPEGFELALGRLNGGGKERILAGQCVVIEDSHWGLKAAKSAGMHTIAVSNTYDSGYLGPYAEMVVNRLDEIKMCDLQGLCG